MYGTIELGRCDSYIHVVFVNTGARIVQECLLSHITYIHRVR